MTAYFVYDVFTDAPFGGNQLAVIPDAAVLPEAQLQKIAREFNYSESVFLYPPDVPDQTARIRIFTPSTEVPFAGHPTIGAAVALADLGHGPDMVLGLGIGPLEARAQDGTAEFAVPARLETFGEPEPALVARCLGLPPEAIVTDRHVPVQASLGLAFVFAELRDRADLSACVPVTDAVREGAARYPAALDFAIFAYVRDADTLHARMFAPLDGVPEDPATGSASATVTALLERVEQRPLALTIRQGEDMGRPSLIYTETVHAGPSCTAIRVRGNAVRTMEGRLTL